MRVGATTPSAWRGINVEVLEIEGESGTFGDPRRPTFEPICDRINALKRILTEIPY